MCVLVTTAIHAGRAGRAEAMLRLMIPATSKKVAECDDCLSRSNPADGVSGATCRSGARCFVACDLGFEVVDVPAHVAAFDCFLGGSDDAVGCPAGEGGAVDAEGFGGFAGSDEVLWVFRGHVVDCRTICLISVECVTCVSWRVVRTVDASFASYASIDFLGGARR